MKTTALIVGGGPAGSSAAFTLLEKGIDTLLIDKATFPRNKLCGGLLTGRAKRVYGEIFGDDFDQAYEYAAQGAGIFEKDTLLNEVSGYSEWYQTSRIYFDDFLLTKAMQAGLKTVLGDAVFEIDLEGKKVTLKSGKTISYQYLIGADGVNSVVGKALFGQSFDKDKVGFALEVELEKGQGRKYQYPSLHFDVLDWGYGWVFPKKNSDTFGLAGLHRLNPDMKQKFQSFHQELYGKPYEGKIHGHYIPFGDFRKKPGNGNEVLLTGDAAGLVEPITGEGIAFALESGAMAARAVAESVVSGKKAYTMYMKGYKVLVKDLKIGLRMAKLLYPKKMNRLFRKILPKADFLVRLHMDLMNEKISYEKFQRYVIGKLAVKGLGYAWKYRKGKPGRVRTV